MSAGNYPYGLDKKDIAAVGGIALTGRDISLDLAKLDVALSTRATETTLSLIKAKTDNIPTDPAKESGKLTNINNKISSGVYTTPTHTAVVVTTASGIALAANANRLYALLINDSDTVIYINLGATAVANQGIRLNADGGSYEMSKRLGSLYSGVINAIHGGTGDKTLLVTEGV